MDDLIIKDPVPTEGTSLEDGAVVMKLRLISKTKDLFITDISPEVESNVGFGPRHDLKVIPFPNLAIYVGTVIAALEPALRAHPSDP